MADEREAGGDAKSITGGTDKAGEGALRASDEPKEADTGVRETGDLTGATSTHAGAGGVFDNTGGTGTAPTGDQ